MRSKISSLHAAPAKAEGASSDPIFLAATLSIIVVATARKFVGLDYQSLWIDELITFTFSQKDSSISQLYATYWAFDAHPPLYYVLIHYWLQWFETTDEIAIRSFSAMMAAFSTALCAVGFTNVLRMPGRILLTILVACNFGLIYYAQEARQYSLLFFFSIAMLSITMAIWRDLQRGTQPIILLFVAMVVAVLLSFTHMFGLFFAFGCWLTIFVVAIRRHNSTFFVVALGSLTGLCVLVWPIVVLSNLDAVKAHNNLAIFNLYANPLILARYTAWLLFGSPLALALMGLIAILVLFKKGLTPRKWAPAALWICLAPALVATVVAIATSLLFFPILSHRNLIVIFPSLLLAIAMVIERNFSSRFLKIVVPTIGVVLLVPSLTGFHEVRKAQWRESARHIRDELGCDSGRIGFFPMNDYEGSPLHRVYLGAGFDPEPALELGDRRESEDLGRSLNATLDALVGVPEVQNRCGVVLWVVQVPSDVLDTVEWPQGLHVKRFFDAAVVWRE